MLSLLLAARGALADPPALVRPAQPDWLLDSAFAKAHVVQTDDAVTLENGLVRRVIRRKPGVTVAFDNLMTGASLLRAVEPEAVVSLGGVEFRVGGALGQENRAFLTTEAIAKLRPDPQAFRLEAIEVDTPSAPLAWKRKPRSADLPWPLPGVAIDCIYRSDDPRTAGVLVTVRYELYDGLPVLGKWISVSNSSGKPVRLDRFESERLAVVEAESAVDVRPDAAWRLPELDVLSDYMFKGMDLVTGNRVATWVADPEYKTQVNFELKTPSVLVVRPPLGPGLDIPSVAAWTSFRSYLVVYDSTERERKGLTLRRVTRALAPWTTENPLMMHVRSGDSQAFRAAVDQCAAVGFEMIIYTFGSGLNMENVDPEYLARIKADVDYAHAHGLEVGGYSLFSSRQIGPETDVIDPKTGLPGGANFGHAPCFGSPWGQDYARKLRTFIEQTGFDLLEHDGPYPGDVCASTAHPGHRGLEDSQWVNWKMSADLYAWCRERGVYVNQPDYYFLAGGNKTAMGYREANWSLPRAQQLLHARQNIFDGTWTKPQTAGWMFVPLTEYHGGGPAATLEPLSEHLPEYEAHLANTLGSGVQACWRGPRLYDTEETKALVARWVAWYKQHRDILESDLLHVRRADGRDLDYMVAVNPKLPTRALAMIHNPLDTPVDRTITLPLYYAGLTGTALIRERDQPPQRYELDGQNRAHVPVTVPAKGRTWLVVEARGTESAR